MAGPIDKIEGTTSQVGGVYRRRYYFTQAKHLRGLNPLRYSFTYYAVKSNQSGKGRPENAIPFGSIVSECQAIAYNKAYKKWSEALGEKADLSVSLAEWHQSADMINRRSNQLYHFFKNLRKGRFGDAFDALDLPRDRRVKPVAKDFAGKVLETNFGWAPLADDIASAVEILQGGIPAEKIYGRATASFGSTKTADSPNASNSYLDQVVSGQVSVHIQAYASVNNPNLWLANQMGFVNPLTFAWELVPYSFVVDWFTNVGDFLSSFTDTVGLSLSREFYTVHHVTPSKRRYRHSDGRIVTDQFERVVTSRVVGTIPKPTLRVRPFNGFSVKRAANAVSLLIQQLPR